MGANDKLAATGALYDEAAACPCTRGPATLHAGHCCFGAGTPDDYAPDKPLPCGHQGPIT